MTWQSHLNSKKKDFIQKFTQAAYSTHCLADVVESLDLDLDLNLKLRV